MQILNGQWWLATDAGNVGKAESWFSGEPASDAQPANVPGAIQQCFPGYHGVAWYWHRFVPALAPDATQRAQLHFEGDVRYLAEAWLNGQFLGGYEGGESPFDLDATGIVRAGQENRLVVRVLCPGSEPIDGYVNNEVPMSGDYGGIMLPVAYRVAPAVRTVDVFARPNIHDGSVAITLTLRNDTQQTLDCRLSAQIGAAMPAGAPAEDAVERTLTVTPGERAVELMLQVTRPHLWNLDDPYLYRVSARLATTFDGQPVTDEYSVRCGFREFRVERGFFRLNGRRVYLRQTHTGNHVPYSQGAPVQPDLVRRDLINAKACGFNSIRFIKGPAWPEQLDFCDELGLMTYEECGGSWLMRDSPHFAERYDRNMDALIRRDRNHPCVTIWGVLNETLDGPVFRHGVNYLSRLRELDPTRLALLSSLRWDGQLGIGSLSNPGSDQWECEWGAEAPGAQEMPFTKSIWEAPVPAYAEGTGDAHVYPFVPHTPFMLDFIRTLGRDSKPVFLSEYGIGSMMNVVRELRKFAHDGARADLSDVATIRSWAERLEADWQRLGFDGVYPFVEDLLRASQRLHVRQRLFRFDLIRSNPQLCGFNCTGILDHGLSGEGLWTFTREWKPGIVDALSDGWSPVRWCLFVDPMHGYVGRKIRVEAVLANEDVLPPGHYPVRFTLNTFAVLEQLGLQPAADRLLANLAACAAAGAREPLAALPGDFGDLLARIGYIQ
jgi:Glycosyl hydrolases family 2, TIM barrel domain/Glycosyl hydrolases family 2/Glycosyl hydrolases family 2, sugar binding domain